MSEATQPLTALAAAANVRRLFWIDDRFGRSPRLVARAIATEVTVLWGLERQPLQHAELREIAVGSDPDAVEGHILSVLQRAKAPDTAADEMMNSVYSQIVPLDADYKLETRDLSIAQFADIHSAFENAGVSVQRLSYAEWLRRESEICADLKPTDLFFVDRDLSLEEGGTATTGQTILKSLLRQPEQLFTCILFTHAVGSEGQQAMHSHVAEAAGLTDEKYRFSVVSKETISSPEAVTGYRALSRAFKQAFVTDWCHSIASESRRALDEAFKETSDLLLGLSLEDLSAALFRRPFSDGTLEADTLLRILMLSARVKLESRKSTNNVIWERLVAIRNVLAVQPQDAAKAPINEVLQQWHDREIFDPPEIVNGAFNPVFLGDVFRVTNKKKTFDFVLIAQPCDLSIRDTAERNNSEALFLRVTDRAPKNDVTSAYEFDFPKLGKRWIHYGGAIPVNLNLLDLVSFRADGQMTFNLQLQKSELMLPGLAKKFDQMRASLSALFKPNGELTGGRLASKYQRLALSGLPILETAVQKDQIVYPIQRIGRIRPPHAEAILGGMAIHHTRVAFEFNFADLSKFCEVCEPEDFCGLPADGSGETAAPSSAPSDQASAELR